jgi:hypothetical protein
MEYENGFYAYTPKEDIETITALDCTQVIQIIEGVIWLTGAEGDYSISYAKKIGTIGKMLMNEDGSINLLEDK